MKLGLTSTIKYDIFLKKTFPHSTKMNYYNVIYRES